MSNGHEIRQPKPYATSEQDAGLARLFPLPDAGQERAEAAQAYREAVARLQASAYRDLRRAIANATVFWAVLVAWMIFIGEVTPARLPWYAASIAGGALGLCTYAVRETRVRRYVLLAAAASTVAGIAGVFLVD
jgi:hypothetical protein